MPTVNRRSNKSVKTVNEEV